MGDCLLPLPLTERSVHLCVDMQRIFSAEGPWPTPLDGQGSCRSQQRSRTSRLEGSRLHPLHSARASRSNAGHVAALLHALARCDARTPGSPAAGADAAAGGALPADKTRYSAFAEPRMIEHLRRR